MDTTVADADLVARAQRGDVEAYAQLIEHNQALAVGLAALVMGDPTDAEDVAKRPSLKRTTRWIGSGWGELPGVAREDHSQ